MRNEEGLAAGHGTGVHINMATPETRIHYDIGQ